MNIKLTTAKTQISHDAPIFVAGHRGLVGSAVLRKLQNAGYKNILVRNRSELNLVRQSSVEQFFDEYKPAGVILAAAKVGGIVANSTYPADFIYENLAIAQNVIHSSWKFGVKKLINLGSSCIYPRMAPQPMKEDALLTGPLEPTNEAYAIAKIAAVKLCVHFNTQYGTNFLSAMPTNMYGPGDNYHLENSHVLPAMIRKFHEANASGKTVTLWGDGSPLREFLYSDDLADAVVHLYENVDFPASGEFVNVGSEKEVSIKNLAEIVASVVGYQGDVNWDLDKPNGTPRKIMDSSRIRELGWKPKIQLRTGVELAYQDFLRRYT